MNSTRREVARGFFNGAVLALAAGLLVVGGFLTLRVVRAGDRGLSPTVRGDEAVEVYRSRIQATHRLLGDGQLAEDAGS